MQTMLLKPTEGIYTHKQLVYPLEIDFFLNEQKKCIFQKFNFC